MTRATRQELSARGCTASPRLGSARRPDRYFRALAVSAAYGSRQARKTFSRAVPTPGGGSSRGFLPHFEWHQQHEHPQRVGRSAGQTDCRIQRPLHSHRGVRNGQQRGCNGVPVHQRISLQPPVRIGVGSRWECWSSTALPSIDEAHWVPIVREADALLVWGGDVLYLCHWMRQSGLGRPLAVVAARDGLRGGEFGKHRC